MRIALPQQTSLALLGAATLLVLGTSCTPTDKPHWTDQLQADSPCYRVDLMNGLDEQSADETRDLFACLDYYDHLESLRPTFRTLDTADANRGILDVARALNAMPDADVDPFALAGVGVDLLRDPNEPLQGLLDISLELATGSPARDVRSGRTNPDDPGVLRGGLIVPLAPVLEDLSSDLLDDDLALVTAVGEGLQGETVHRWVHSTAEVAASAHPDLRALSESLPQHIGDAVLDTRDGQDGLWVSGSDDSLRDLVTVLTGDGRTPGTIDVVAEPLAELLADDGVRTRTGALLRSLEQGGHLAELPDELGWLTSVNVDGDPASRGEPSGLEALARLLGAANRPMVCTLDLGFTDVSVNLGNLSVSLLGVINDLEPGTVQSSAGVVGSLLDSSITQSVLTAVAGSGVCPALTPTLVSDLQVVDLLFDPRATHLVTAFLGITEALEAEGQLVLFVDLLDQLWETDTIWALGDVIRDTSDSPLWDDLMAGIPILLDPTSVGLDPQGVDFDDAWEALEVLLTDPDVGWTTTAPILGRALTADGTWQAIGSFAELMADGRSTSSTALTLVDRWASADPELELLDALGRVLQDRAISEPLMRAVDRPGTVDNLMADTPVAGQQQVPLAFWCRLVTTGALDELLSLVDRTLGVLQTGEDS